MRPGYLARLTNSEPYVAYVWHTAPVQSLTDLLRKELIVGATTPGTTMNDFPQLTNEVLGTKFKIVSGYASTPQLNQAMERGETEGVGGSAGRRERPSSAMDDRKQDQGDRAVRLHAAASSADVPLMFDLADSAADRQALMMLFGRTEYGRPYFLPPGVPAERVQLCGALSTRP